MKTSSALITGVALGLSLVVTLSTACSDPAGSGGDATIDSAGPAKDLGGGLPDGYGPLWPCPTPGQACNAHDPCAIQPICGPDKQCRPTKVQRCDDDLACTEDVCKGMGQCDNVPKKGSCALPVRISGSAGPDGGGGSDGSAADASVGPSKTVTKCFNSGDRRPDDPCLTCDPTKSATTWSNASGGTCDDGQSCTKDDYCQDGLCKGTSYASQCQDTFSCTEDLCDGKGGCLGNKLKSGFCLVNGVCYKDGDKHPSGTCFSCDATADPSGWTAISDTCTIGGKCYAKGDKHSGACAECSPGTSATSWTVTGTTHCLINDACVASGAKDSTQCSACDPSSDKYDYTALPGLCKIAGACYAQGAKHSGGCAECAPATSATSWTVTGTTHCLISDACVTSGSKDSTGCGVCTPASDKYAYSAVAGQCKIGNTCYSTGAQHPKGCAECKPAVSATSWTLLSSATGCLISGECYAKDATAGCFKCDPVTSQTAWTQIAGCNYVDLDIGTHGSVYTDSSHTRGYWFTAPVDFTIIGLRVPTVLGTGVQNVELLKFTAAPTTAGTTSYTSLFYAKGVAGTAHISCNVAVKKGDFIGVVGARGTTTMNNSYASAYTYATKISNQAVTLQRLMVQNNLYSSKSSGSIMSNSHYYGRVELRYKP
jgi:hypothetical protein